MRTIVTIFFLFIVSPFLLHAHNEKIYYEAFISNHPEKWKNLLDASEATTLSMSDKINKLQYLYGYIGWNIRENRKEEGIKYLREMEELLKTLSLPENEQCLFNSIVLSFGILLGTRNPVTNGRKVVKQIDKALAAPIPSSLAYIQKGNTYLNMPALFGGSRKKALEWFLRARQLLEKEDKTTRNWLYIHLLCTICETYQANEQPSEAEHYYLYIKQLEPNLFWLEENKKAVLKTGE